MRGGIKSCLTQGFSTLVFTLVILLSITMLATVSSQAVITHQKSLVDYRQGQTAFEAAQAGLDYAIPYLDAHYATLSDGANFTQTFPDGTSFATSVQYLGSKDVLRVTSVGRSSDGVETQTISKILQYKTPETVIQWPYAVQSRKTMLLKDSSKLIDLGGNIYSARVGSSDARAVEILDHASTVLSTGTASTAATAAAARSDITVDTTLFTKTDEQMQTQFLGQTIDHLQDVTTAVTMPSNAGMPQGTYIYDYNASTFAPYSSAASVTLVQSNGEAQMKGATTIGSADHPKNLVVEVSGTYVLPSGERKASEFQMRENAEIYGDLIVNGNVTITDASKIHGNIIADGSVTLVDGSTLKGSIIAKGEVRLMNNAKVEGAVFSLSNVHLDNDAVIKGAAVAGNQVYLGGNSKIDYNTDLAKVVTAGTAVTSGYGALAGSWSDF